MGGSTSGGIFASLTVFGSGGGVDLERECEEGPRVGKEK